MPRAAVNSSEPTQADVLKPALLVLVGLSEVLYWTLPQERLELCARPEKRETFDPEEDVCLKKACKRLECS